MSVHGEDAALVTLLLPFVTRQLTWPEDGALFLRARPGQALQAHSYAGLVCEQSFKPEADALQRAGFRLNLHVDGEETDARKYSLVLVLPPRQRDEARALYARAVSVLKSGGRIVACVSNNEGARSSEADLEKLTGALTTLSKNKCRVFWSASLDAPVDHALVSQWRALDAIRSVAGGKFASRPGVFAWDRIDVASALLAQHLPGDLHGDAADLGTGFGYLAVELLQRASGVTSLDVYEAEQRALDLARLNLSTYETSVPVKYFWHDVTVGLRRNYDLIITNPPFHTQNRIDRPDVGRRFIAVAAQALNPGGQLWLVANRHLAYEETLNSSFGEVKVIAQQQGFKIIAATKARAAASFRKGSL